MFAFVFFLGVAPLALANGQCAFALFGGVNPTIQS
jgi:hypothetical protein